MLQERHTTSDQKFYPNFFSDFFFYNRHWFELLASTGYNNVMNNATITTPFVVVRHARKCLPNKRNWFGYNSRRCLLWNPEHDLSLNLHSWMHHPISTNMHVARHIVLYWYSLVTHIHSLKSSYLFQKWQRIPNPFPQIPLPRSRNFGMTQIASEYGVFHPISPDLRSISPDQHEIRSFVVDLLGNDYPRLTLRRQ